MSAKTNTMHILVHKDTFSWEWGLFSTKWPPWMNAPFVLCWVLPVSLVYQKVVWTWPLRVVLDVSGRLSEQLILIGWDWWFFIWIWFFSILMLLTICLILWKLFPWKLKACSNKTLSSTVHSSGKGVKLGKSARAFSMLCLCQNNIPNALKMKRAKIIFSTLLYF